MDTNSSQRVNTRLHAVVSIAILCAGCRSQVVPEPSATSTTTSNTPSMPPMPAAPSQPRILEPARMNLHAPVSVAVAEEVEKLGQKDLFEYRVDVCASRSQGSYLVSHRDLRVTQVNGTPAETALSARERQQIEFATSMLPTMEIDASGTFVRATGWDKTIDQLAKTFPDMNIAALRSRAHEGLLQAGVTGEMSTRWNAWIGTWAQYDGPRGGTQRLTVPPQGGSMAVGLADSQPPKGGWVRFEANRTFTSEELHAAAALIGPALADTGVDVNDVIQKGEQRFGAELPWPDLLPRGAFYRTTMHFKLQGQDTEFVENHVFRFDWAHASGDAQCDNAKMVK